LLNEKKLVAELAQTLSKIYSGRAAAGLSRTRPVLQSRRTSSDSKTKGKAEVFRGFTRGSKGKVIVLRRIAKAEKKTSIPFLPHTAAISCAPQFGQCSVDDGSDTSPAKA
jgi:hypothetical protein